MLAGINDTQGWVTTQIVATNSAIVQRFYCPSKASTSLHVTAGSITSSVVHLSPPILCPVDNPTCKQRSLIPPPPPTLTSPPCLVDHPWLMYGMHHKVRCVELCMHACILSPQVPRAPFGWSPVLDNVPHGVAFSLCVIRFLRVPASPFGHSRSLTTQTRCSTFGLFVPPPLPARTPNRYTRLRTSASPVPST